MATDPVDNAWKIHSALADWTGKVDAKASFALTIESALLVGIVTLSSSGRIFSSLSGWAMFWYAIGISLIISGVLCAALVVRPRLRSEHLAAESHSNYVYFGHLRNLTPSAVQIHLEETAILPVLSKQLAEMSRIAWTKHKRVQQSMTLAPCGVLALGVAALLSQ